VSGIYKGPFLTALLLFAVRKLKAPGSFRAVFASKPRGDGLLNRCKTKKQRIRGDPKRIARRLCLYLDVIVTYKLKKRYKKSE
jgi:hypothetical protein